MKIWVVSEDWYGEYIPTPFTTEEKAREFCHYNNIRWDDDFELEVDPPISKKPIVGDLYTVHDKDHVWRESNRCVERIQMFDRLSVYLTRHHRPKGYSYTINAISEEQAVEKFHIARDEFLAGKRDALYFKSQFCRDYHIARYGADGKVALGSQYKLLDVCNIDDDEDPWQYKGRIS